MKRLILFLLLVNVTIVISQNSDTHTSFRQITGVLIDENEMPFPGQNVIILGTTVGTQTDFDGKFCLTIPNDILVFISLPFCFEQITRQVKSDDTHLILQIGKKKRKSERAMIKWNLVSDKQKLDFQSIYRGNAYLKAQKSYCQ